VPEIYNNMFTKIMCKNGVVMYTPQGISAGVDNEKLFIVEVIHGMLVSGKID
jgi:hypothetical protein